MHIEVNNQLIKLTEEEYDYLVRVLNKGKQVKDPIKIIEKEVKYLKEKIKESEDIFNDSYELFKNHFELLGALKELNFLKKTLEGCNE